MAKRNQAIPITPASWKPGEPPASGFWKHLSGANKINPGCQSILQANLQAQQKIQNYQCAMHQDDYSQPYPSEAHAANRRYQKEFEIIGRATRARSKDKIY